MGDEDRTASGQRIRKARRKMGLSQIEVAGLADVSRRTVQNAESGSASVKRSSLRAIGDVVHLDLYEDQAIESEALVSNVASFGYLPFRMFKFVGSRIKPSELAFCYDEQEFLLELETLWQNFERGLAGFCPIKASRFVEVHPNFCRKQGYMERYLGIWRANPKSFSFSETGGRRSGVSIVLPVAKPTFMEFLAGRRSSFGISPDEIVSQSSTIIYESIAPYFDQRERPHSLGGTLAFTALNHLSHVLPYVRTEPCDLASFGAHEENIERMRNVGMTKTGTYIPRLDYPVWQTSNHADFSSSDDQDDEIEIRSSTFSHFLSLNQSKLKRGSVSMRAKLSFSAIGALQAHRIAKQASQDRNAA